MPEQVENDLEHWKWSVNLRLEGVRTAATRSRFVLLASAVTSGAFMFSGFNYFFSWAKTFTLLEPWASDDKSQIGYLQRHIVDKWIDAQAFEVPFLGVKLLTNDLTIVLPPCLLIIMVWLFFSVRREHFTIARLLIEANKRWPPNTNPPGAELLVRQAVYHGISANLIFTVMRDDDPIDRLGADPKLPTIAHRAAARGDLMTWLSRGAIVLLFYFPVLAIFFNFMCRLMMFLPPYLIHTPYRPGHIHMLTTLREWTLFYVMCASSIASGVLAMLFARSVCRFEVQTRALMDEYAEASFGTHAAPAPRLPVSSSNDARATAERSGQGA